MDIYRIWDGLEKPYHKVNELVEREDEQWGTRCVFDVTEPTLSVYPAQGANSGVGVIILPGGGYTAEAIDAEGHDVAEVLSAAGITAAVLKYRLPNPKSSDSPEFVPVTDTWRALALLRELAGEYGVNQNKVGLLGFSAGSHLAAVASLWQPASATERPNFSGLLYGNTMLTDENIKWLEESLYFRKMTSAELDQNRLLDLVTPQTPPAFLAHAYDDDVCYVEESTLYAQKLFENHVLVEMHLFPKGGHGLGLGHAEDGTNQWPGLFVNWLRRFTT